MDLVDISGVSTALFLTGVLFILMIGSFLSLGVMRFFQMKKKQGILFLALSALSLAGLIVSVNTWFV